MADEEALLQGLRKVGLTGPPPGFSGQSQPQSQRPQQQNGLEFDEVHLTSIFRLALDEDGVFRPQPQQQQQGPPQQQPQPMYYSPPQGPQGGYSNHPQAGGYGNVPQAGGYGNQPQIGGYGNQPQPFQAGAPPRQGQFPAGQFPPQQFPPAQFQGQFPPPQQMGYPPQQHQISSPGMRAGMPQQGMPPPMMQMSPRPMGPPSAGMPMPMVGMSMMPPPPAPFPQPINEPRDFRFRDSERMKGREINFVVRTQLRAVETGDEFADDFYHLQSLEKKRASSSQHAHRLGMSGKIEEASNDDRPAELLKFLKDLQSKSGNARSGMRTLQAPSGPLPELSKTVQQEYLEKKNKQNMNASTKWAGAKNVLGRVVKGNIRTPRELIALQEALMSEDDGKRNSNECFSSAGWELRKVSMEVSDLLGEVSDLSRHLKARAAAIPAGSGGQGWEFFNEKLSVLEKQQSDACERLARAMGLLDGDDALLLRLLWLPKGRRTAIKAMNNLLPEHLILFLEAAARLLVYFTCTSPDGKDSSIAAEREKFELDMSCANAIARDLARVDLAEATKCLKLFLDSQSPESLRAVIATAGGALVTKSLLLHGQDLSVASTDAELAKAWTDAFDIFISMAEEGITAKEASRS